jgi:DNA-binding GntR family transcriptional regulator
MQGETWAGVRRDRDLSAVEQAYTRIRELIVSLELPPGSTIREDELRDRLDLGQTPVREALRRLALDNMLVIYPRRATAVATLGVREVREIYEVRLALEPFAAGLAAQRLTIQQEQELHDLRNQLAETSAGPDLARYNPANRAFHLAVARFSRNAFLADDIDHIQALSHWLWNMYFELHGLNRTEFMPHVHVHEKLIEALLARDPQAAEATMRDDIIKSREELLTRI